MKHKGVVPGVEFHVSGHSLTTVFSVKLLGIEIDDTLSFDEHISTLCAKGSHEISALRCTIKCLTLEDCMFTTNAFIAYNFDYCNTF